MLNGIQVGSCGQTNIRLSCYVRILVQDVKVDFVDFRSLFSLSEHNNKDEMTVNR